MIDWTKPLEAYHTDGRVVPVELANGPDGDGDYKLTEPLEQSTRKVLFFTRDGRQRFPLGTYPWRIRNRQSAATTISAGEEFLVGTDILPALGLTRTTEAGETLVAFSDGRDGSVWRKLRHIERIVETETTDPDHLTITITGPQGCGKTRMARHLRSWLRNNGASVENAPTTAAPPYDLIDGHRVTVIDASGDDQ